MLSVICFECAYDPSIARLDYRGHVWRQVENAGVTKDHVHFCKLLQGDVARVVVQQKEDLATLHPVIKVQQPESKDVVGHPHLCIGVITGAQRIAVDTFETTWIQVLADDRQRNFFAAVRVCANDKSDALLVDFPAFQLMGCQRVVGLETPTKASFIHVEHVFLCVRINNGADVR